jgi:HAD superfamily hydrolase (TIGR01509 family)
MTNLRAIIFDFDGVIADTEPLHFAGFRQVLHEQGITLTESDYYARYLGYDDKGCFAAALSTHQRPAPRTVIDELVARKSKVYLESIQHHLVIFPGVREFVHAVAARYPLAIASGALRHEIELILECAGIRKEFQHITSSEDVTRGKPDPQGFLHALAALNQNQPGSPITTTDCLVIEDSIPGIRGARAAGMKVLAVANTHTVQDLCEADAIVHCLEEVRLGELRDRLWGD